MIFRKSDTKSDTGWERVKYLISVGKPAPVTDKNEYGWTEAGRNDLETFFGSSGMRWLPDNCLNNGMNTFEVECNCNM